MDNLEFLRLLPLIPGLLFVAIGWLVKRNPPRRRHVLYGFRTFSSVKNQELWDAAQLIGARESIRLGVIQLAFGLFIAATVATEIFPVVYMIVSGIACGIAVIARTEIQLRQRYGVQDS